MQSARATSVVFILGSLIFSSCLYARENREPQATPRSEVSDQTPPRYRPSIIIDTTAMDEHSRAEVVAGILKLTEVGSAGTIKVAAGDTMSGIINDQYRFYDSKYPKTTAAIAQQVLVDNGLSPASDIKAGQQLTLRALPVRPLMMGAKPNLGQFLSLETGALSAMNIARSGLPDLAISDDVAGAPKGATWVLNSVSAEAAQQFVSDLTPSVRDQVMNRAVYIGPTTQTTTVHLLSSGANCSGSGRAYDQQPGVANANLSVDPALAGKLYTIDAFQKVDGQCSHGEMVEQVTRLVLESVGAANLEPNNVVRVDLNFRQNQATQSYIDTFAHSLTQTNESQIKDIWKSLAKNKPAAVNGNEIDVPLLYLVAVNVYLLTSGDTSVISSSFWTYYDRFGWLPPEYSPDSNVNFVTAVLDDGSDQYATYVEDALWSKHEPIHTFFSVEMNYGVVLVGAEKSPGVPFGMRSQTGAGVTFVGRGFGWGDPASCLGETGGTSFAAPQIATELFLAKA